MKAALIFNLPEDQGDFTLASTAVQWALVVHDMDNLLHKYIKYGHKFESADEVLESIREDLYGLLEVRSISLDMIE